MRRAAGPSRQEQHQRAVRLPPEAATQQVRWGGVGIDEGDITVWPPLFRAYSGGQPLCCNPERVMPGSESYVYATTSGTLLMQRCCFLGR